MPYPMDWLALEYLYEDENDGWYHDNGHRNVCRYQEFLRGKDAEVKEQDGNLA
jgi:hypothetical protein